MSANKWSGTGPMDDLANIALKIENGLASSMEDKVEAGKVFAVSTNDITSGTGGQESARVNIQNPANSGKVMKIYHITFGTNVSSNNNIFRLYKSSTVTDNGIELPSVNLNFSAIQPVSLMKVYRNPTVSVNGTLFMNIISGATAMNQISLDQLIHIPPGEGLVINVRPNTNSVFFQ